MELCFKQGDIPPTIFLVLEPQRLNTAFLKQLSIAFCILILPNIWKLHANIELPRKEYRLLLSYWKIGHGSKITKLA